MSGSSKPEWRDAAWSRVRQAATSLLSRVRPERGAGTLPALPAARKKEVIKADPERYGFIQRKVLPETEARPPWETATFPALTDGMIAAIEAGTFRSLRPGGGAA